MSHVRILVFWDGLLRNLKESRTGIPTVGNSASCMTSISFILEIRNGWTNIAASVEPNEANIDLLPVFRILSGKKQLATLIYMIYGDQKITYSRRRTFSGFTLLDFN